MFLGLPQLWSVSLVIVRTAAGHLGNCELGALPHLQEAGSWREGEREAICMLVNQQYHRYINAVFRSFVGNIRKIGLKYFERKYFERKYFERKLSCVVHLNEHSVIYITKPQTLKGWGALSTSWS